MLMEPPWLLGTGKSGGSTAPFEMKRFNYESLGGVSSRNEMYYGRRRWSSFLQEYALLGLLVFFNSLLGVAFASAGIYRLQLKTHELIHVRECLK